MLLRKLSGFTAGAVTAGLLVAPGLMGAAQAAPVTETVNQDLICTYNDFGTVYEADIQVTVDGTAVSATLNDVPPFGMPAFLQIGKITGDLQLKVNDEAVVLTGEKTHDPKRAGNLALPIPAVAGTRTSTDAVDTLAVEGLSIGMTVSMGTTTMEATTECAVKAPTTHTIEQDLICTYNDFGTVYEARLETSVEGDKVSATMNEIPPFGMPAFLQIGKITGNLKLKVNGESVTLTGEEAHDPKRAGNLALPIPALTGTRTKWKTPSTYEVEGLSIGMTVSMGTTTMNATTDCVVKKPVTTTVATELYCFYGTYGTVHNAEVVTSVEGDKVSATINDIPPFGMPAFLQIGKISSDLDLKVNGEAVKLKGEQTYDPKRAGNLALPIPASAGTRTKWKAPSTVEVAGLKVDMTVSMGTTTLDATTECVVVQDSATVLTATGGEGEVELSAAITPATAAGEVEFFEGTTSLGKVTVADGVATKKLTGVDASAHSYKAVFTTKGAHRPSEDTVDVTVDKITTVTTVTAASRKASTVELKLAVAPVAPGKFVVKEGAKTLATVVAVNGAATVTLTGVTKGKHTYAVNFVPTSANHKASAAASTAVTVAAAKTKTKISSAKVKSKKVTVKGTVKVGSQKATGKVKIVVKKGNKTVFSKTVTLKKGAFSVKSKSLKAGKHKVTVTFTANGHFNKSSASKTFTVK